MGKMNPGMKMLMMDRMRQPENNRSEYGGGNRRMIGYDRDMNGQATTSNYGGTPYMGGYERGMPHMGGYGMEPESRRRRDSRGRYMMGGMGGMDDDDDYDRRMMDDPPHMTGSRYGIRNVYADIHTGGVANRPSGGMTNGDMSRPVDEHTARMWVERMDGGEHFKPEQADPLRSTICPECGKWEWYVAMNAMYSDHCETAKKLGMDKPEFYAHMAKDFLMDTDAKPHKLRRYMEHIAK